MGNPSASLLTRLIRALSFRAWLPVKLMADMDFDLSLQALSAFFRLSSELFTRFFLCRTVNIVCIFIIWMPHWCGFRPLCIRLLPTNTVKQLSILKIIKDLACWLSLWRRLSVFLPDKGNPFQTALKHHLTGICKNLYTSQLLLYHETFNLISVWGFAFFSLAKYRCTFDIKYTTPLPLMPNRQKISYQNALLYTDNLFSADR